jgi:DNA-binding HxlR family transcriptional regulator
LLLTDSGYREETSAPRKPHAAPPQDQDSAMALIIRKNRSPKPPLCPIGAGMAFLGGAWTPNIIWYLVGGPRRFGELKHDIPAISAKMLSTRLKALEAKGVVTRSLLATSPPSAEYALTDLGHEMVPLIEAIAKFGMKLKQAEIRTQAAE